MKKRELNEAWIKATPIDDDVFYLVADELELIDTTPASGGWVRRLYRDKTDGSFRYRWVK